MIFAAILFIVSFSSFSSLMKILRDLYDLHDNPRNYSLVTICLTCMWDAALCIVAFIYAFSDQ
jgi:Trk-type K+ transport system membrane component